MENVHSFERERQREGEREGGRERESKWASSVVPQPPWACLFFHSPPSPPHPLPSPSQQPVQVMEDLEQRLGGKLEDASVRHRMLSVAEFGLSEPISEVARERDKQLVVRQRGAGEYNFQACEVRGREGTGLLPVCVLHW